MGRALNFPLHVQMCSIKVERLKKYDSMCAEELLEIVKGTQL